MVLLAANKLHETLLGQNILLRFVYIQNLQNVNLRHEIFY